MTRARVVQARSLKSAAWRRGSMTEGGSQT